MKLGDFFVVLSVLLGLVWVVGQFVLFTLPWVPWKLIFDSLPIIVITFVVCQFLFAIMSKSPSQKE